jgi:hypothetical protein
VCFGKECVHPKYIKLIKDMYDRTVTSVRTSGGITSEFPITRGLHQGSAFFLYKFASRICIKSIFLDICFLHMI